MVIEKYTYDETDMRTRAIEMVQQGRERDFYDVLHIYKDVRSFTGLDLEQLNTVELQWLEH